MKIKIFFSLLCLLCCSPIFSQEACVGGTAEAELDANNVRAKLKINGSFLQNPTGGYQIETTEPGEFHKIQIPSGLWLGGVDGGGNLKLAAQQYDIPNSSDGDFYPGPLSLTEGITEFENCQNFDRFWKIAKSDIDLFLADFADNGTIDQTPALSLMTWPGRGNPHFAGISAGFELPHQPLAPFEDLNANGIYEPLLGDFPKIKGDQAIWWVFNDQGGGSMHGESGGDALHAEVHAMAYAFDSQNEAISNTTFYDVTVINRANEAIDSLFISWWMDPDFQCPFTPVVGNYDQIGCIPEEKLAFAFASDSSCADGSRSIGIKVLEGPKNELGEDKGFSSFMYYIRQGSGTPAIPPAMTDPVTALEFYQYMNAVWRDGTPLNYGGDGYDPFDQFVDFAFSGDPSDPSEWSVCNSGLANYDRRMLINSGTVSLLPGAQTSLTFAVIYSPEANNLCEDFAPLQNVADEVQAFYEELVPINEPDLQELSTILAPNPMRFEAKLQLKDTRQTLEQVQIFSLDGRLVRDYKGINSNELLIRREGLPTGIFVLKILTSDGSQGVQKLMLLE